jgi:TATA-box binding protein (TBP) (component of TFIID and TFIIIB)
MDPLDNDDILQLLGLNPPERYEPEEEEVPESVDYDVLFSSTAQQPSQSVETISNLPPSEEPLIPLEEVEMAEKGPLLTREEAEARFPSKESAAKARTKEKGPVQQPLIPAEEIEAAEQAPIQPLEEIAERFPSQKEPAAKVRTKERRRRAPTFREAITKIVSAGQTRVQQVQSTKPKRWSPRGDDRLPPSGITMKKSPYSRIGKPTIQVYAPSDSLQYIDDANMFQLKTVGLVAMICIGGEIASLLPAAFHMRNSYYHSKWRSLHLSYPHLKSAVIVHEKKGIITCFGRRSHDSVVNSLKKTVAVLNILGYPVKYRGPPLYLNVIQSIKVPYVLNLQNIEKNEEQKFIRYQMLVPDPGELQEFPGRNFYDGENRILITVFEGSPETKTRAFKPARIIYKVRRGETIGSGKTRGDIRYNEKYAGEELSYDAIVERIAKTNQKFLDILDLDSRRYARKYSDHDDIDEPESESENESESEDENQ